jgi:hypothetical protein
LTRRRRRRRGRRRRKRRRRMLLVMGIHSGRAPLAYSPRAVASHKKGRHEPTFRPTLPTCLHINVKP